MSQADRTDKRAEATAVLLAQLCSRMSHHPHWARRNPWKVLIHQERTVFCWIFALFSSIKGSFFVFFLVGPSPGPHYITHIFLCFSLLAYQTCSFFLCMWHISYVILLCIMSLDNFGSSGRLCLLSDYLMQEHRLSLNVAIKKLPRV